MRERGYERERAAGCCAARQPGTQQMSSCSPGLQRLSSELPLQMTHLPTKQPVLFAHNGLINALMILHIFSRSPLFQSCYRNQMSVGPFEILLNVKIKNITVLAARASFHHASPWVRAPVCIFSAHNSI